VANTELPSGGAYMLRWLAECLVSNILVIVEIVPGNDNFIAVGFRYFSNPPLYRLAADSTLWVVMGQIHEGDNTFPISASSPRVLLIAQ